MPWTRTTLPSHRQSALSPTSAGCSAEISGSTTVQAPFYIRHSGIQNPSQFTRLHSTNPSRNPWHSQEHVLIRVDTCAKYKHVNHKRYFCENFLHKSSRTKPLGNHLKNENNPEFPPRVMYRGTFLLNAPATTFFANAAPGMLLAPWLALIRFIMSGK
jgi:hypothetical protein